MSRQGQFGRWIWLWAACYVALLGLTVWWLFAARREALREAALPGANLQWEAWREDVRQEQTKPALVQRRVPASDEPPATILLRDYFGVMLAGAVVLSSFLYWVVAWFVTGAWTTNATAAIQKGTADSTDRSGGIT
jgi:hypothetical protein